MNQMRKKLMARKAKVSVAKKKPIFSGLPPRFGGASGARGGDRANLEQDRYTEVKIRSKKNMSALAG